MPSKTLRSEKLDLRLTRKGNARMPHCARNSYKISKVAAFASSKNKPTASPSVPYGLFSCRETFCGDRSRRYPPGRPHHRFRLFVDVPHSETIRTKVIADHHS